MSKNKGTGRLGITVADGMSDADVVAELEAQATETPATDIVIEAGEGSTEEQARKTQNAAVLARKALSMSRRQLSVELGWTESRVWYLEQDSIVYGNERNLADLRAMLTKLTLCISDGWTKPSVKTAMATTTKASGPRADALALQVRYAELQERYDVLKARLQDEQKTIKSVGLVIATVHAFVSNAIDEAKAKKSSTKALAEVERLLGEIVWSM